MGVKIVQNDKVKELKRELLTDVIGSTVEISDNAFIMASELIEDIILESFKDGYSVGYGDGYDKDKKSG